MSQLETLVCEGLQEFESLAPQWDELWWRSGARQPASLSAGLKNWVRSFSSSNALAVVGVKSENRLVAAIPLIRDDVRGVLPCHRLPTNCWGNSGDLLLDRGEEAGPLVEQLVGGLIDHGCGLLTFDEIDLEGPQWVAFRQVVDDRFGHSYVAREGTVGVVDVLHDWQRYEQSWSSNHRGAVKRSHRKLLKQGTLRTERYKAADAEQLTSLLRTAFEMEDRTWKGEAGSSVLKTPGMFDFMLGEAMATAESGCLDVWFLYLDDKPIAFEYCHFAKGVCFSHKIGYEPEYSKFGPGRLLRYLQLEEYHADSSCTTFDMLGTICDSKAKWATRTYQTGQVRVAIGGGWKPLLMKSLGWVHPRIRSLRGQDEVEIPRLGAAKVLEPSEGHLAT